MATTDLRRTEKFDQKRGVCLGIYDLDFSDINGDGSHLATFAPGTIITGVTLIEKTAATATAKFDLAVGSVDSAGVFTSTDVIVDEGALDATNVATVVLTDLTTAKDLVIKDGAGTAASAGTFKLIVEYVEYLKTTGEYTRS